jgi:hypothetical protein
MGPIARTIEGSIPRATGLTRPLAGRRPGTMALELARPMRTVAGGHSSHAMESASSEKFALPVGHLENRRTSSTFTPPLRGGRRGVLGRPAGRRPDRTVRDHRTRLRGGGQCGAGRVGAGRGVYDLDTSDEIEIRGVSVPVVTSGRSRHPQVLTSDNAMRSQPRALEGLPPRISAAGRDARGAAPGTSSNGARSTSATA